MLSIMSINKKFMDYSPEELISIITDYKYVDGFEIYVDCQNKQELDYLRELARVCKKYNKHFQVHGNSQVSIEEQKKYMTLLSEISDFLGYKISVVLHSVIAEDKQTSIDKTIQYMNEITDFIDTDKIIIGLENLNTNGYDGYNRLVTDEITPIVCNNQKLFFTYDIGHAIINFDNVANVYWAMSEQISNVHIHSFDNRFSEGFDHKPIYKNDEHWNNIIKGILFLKQNNYKYSIVFEYDLYMCNGETIEDKIRSYAESIDYVAERFK